MTQIKQVYAEKAVNSKMLVDEYSDNRQTEMLQQHLIVRSVRNKLKYKIDFIMS